MSAAESDESRWPDLATASIRTHSSRSSVAQRSSSATVAGAPVGSPWRAGGFGSGTGRRWVTCARLAAFSGSGSARTPGAKVCDAPDARRRPIVRKMQRSESVARHVIYAPRSPPRRIAACGDEGRARPDDRDRDHGTGGDHDRHRPPAPRPGEGEVSPQTATKPHGPAESGEADPRVTAARARRRRATVRAYVAALDARDGAAGSARCSRPARSTSCDCPCPRRLRAPRSRPRSATATRAGCPYGRAPRSPDIRSVELRGLAGAGGGDHGHHVRRPRRALGRGRRRLPGPRRRGAGSWLSRARPFTVRSGSPTSPRRCSPRRADRPTLIDPEGSFGEIPN